MACVGLDSNTVTLGEKAKATKALTGGEETEVLDEEGAAAIGS